MAGGAKVPWHGRVYLTVRGSARMRTSGVSLGGSESEAATAAPEATPPEPEHAPRSWAYRGFQRVRRLLEGWPFQVSLITAEIAFFSTLWTILDWQRYQTLHLGVFDFGVSVRDIWSARSGPLISEHIIANLFVPIYWLSPSQSGFFLFLLAFQNVFVYLGAVPLYLVARSRLKSGLAGLGLASAYVVYPPLTGMLWSPFHFEAFFPTLFLTGYWLYRTGHGRTAASAFLVAETTNIGAPILIGALGIGMLLDRWGPGWWGGSRSRATPARGTGHDVRLALFLVASSVGMLALVVFGQGLTSSAGLVERAVSPGNGAISVTFDPLGAIGNKIGVILLVFAPLLFLPLWAREERWPLVVFWAPAILTVSSVFLDPFHDQYGCLLVPIVFAAAVRGLEQLQARPANPPGVAPVSHRWVPHPWSLARRVRSSGKLSLLVFALVASTAVFISPFSPLNSSLGSVPGLSGLTYGTSALTSGNLTLDTQIRAMVAAVPSGGPALVQDNLPELFERNGAQVAGCFNLSQDPIQYVVTDPFDPSFLTAQEYPPSCTATISMFHWANYFLNQSWGILAEADGAVALAVNYSAPPQVCFPASEPFGATAFSSALGPGAYDWNRSGAGLFSYGPTPAAGTAAPLLYPGEFRVTLALAVDDPATADRATWALKTSAGGPSFNVTLSGANWSGTSGRVRVSTITDSVNYVKDPTFTLYVDQWSGGLRFLGVTLQQLSPC